MNLKQYNQIKNPVFLKNFKIIIIMALEKELRIIYGSNDIVYID